MSALKKLQEIRLAQQKSKRLKAQNEKLDIELQQMKGQYVDIEVFKRDVTASIMAAKMKFLALPSKVAPQLLGLTGLEEIQAVLRREVEDILGELAYGGSGQTDYPPRLRKPE